MTPNAFKVGATQQRNQFIRMSSCASCYCAKRTLEAFARFVIKSSTYAMVMQRHLEVVSCPNLTIYQCR